MQCVSFKSTGLLRLIVEVYFKYFSVQTHVKAERESSDLNMDIRSFDNGFKQLYE